MALEGSGLKIRPGDIRFIEVTVTSCTGMTVGFPGHHDHLSLHPGDHRPEFNINPDRIWQSYPPGWQWLDPTDVPFELQARPKRTPHQGSTHIRSQLLVRVNMRMRCV